MTDDDLDNYLGEWVLLRNGEVIDHDPDPDRLRERVVLGPDDALVPIGDPPTGYRVQA